MNKIFFIVILLINSKFIFAKNTVDSSRFKLTGEILYSKSKQQDYQSANFSWSDLTKKRTEYYLTICGEIDRSQNKFAPWCSPLFALGSGYFIAEYNNMFGSNYGYFNNGNRVSYVKKDTFGFSSVPLIPQVGLQFYPFLRSKRFRNMAISIRTGYQINFILGHYSINNITENEWIEENYQEYYNIHNNKTKYLSFKENAFPKTYLQLGMSNLFRTGDNKRMGYRLSYSYHGKIYKGIEISLTCKL